MRKFISIDKVSTVVAYIYFFYLGYLVLVLLNAPNAVWFLFHGLIFLVNVIVLFWKQKGSSYFSLSDTPEEAVRRAYMFKSINTVSVLKCCDMAMVLCRYEGKISPLFAEYVLEKGKWRGIIDRKRKPVKTSGFNTMTPPNLYVNIYAQVKIIVVYRQSVDEPPISAIDSVGTKFVMSSIEGTPPLQSYRIWFGCTDLKPSEFYWAQAGNERVEIGVKA